MYINELLFTSEEDAMGGCIRASVGWVPLIKFWIGGDKKEEVVRLIGNQKKRTPTKKGEERMEKDWSSKYSKTLCLLEVSFHQGGICTREIERNNESLNGNAILFLKVLQPRREEEDCIACQNVPLL